MNQEHFEKINETFKQIQKPFQDLAELNVKTLQELSLLKPEDFTKLKKPEELLEKQIKLAVENSHKALDYMQKSFEIYEKAMLSFVSQAKKNVAETKKAK